jgi:hypothetical protein
VWRCGEAVAAGDRSADEAVECALSLDQNVALSVDQGYRGKPLEVTGVPALVDECEQQRLMPRGSAAVQRRNLDRE